MLQFCALQLALSLSLAVLVRKDPSDKGTSVLHTKRARKTCSRPHPDTARRGQAGLSSYVLHIRRGHHYCVISCTMLKCQARYPTA